MGGNDVGKACGKVILLGEHAVVYGVPALAVGIDRGARATARAAAGPASTLRVPGWNVEVREGDGAVDLARAFTAVLDATRRAQERAPDRDGRPVLGAVDVEAESDLPPGGGLGCSAALGVAVARAVAAGAGPLTDAVAAERAMAWERVFHGNPSGVDAAVAAAGGCVRFERGRGLAPVRLRSPLLLCVGHSGAPSSTRSMVEHVARFRERRPEVAASAFATIAELVNAAMGALAVGDVEALGHLLSANQEALATLRLSTPEIDTMCNLALGAGAHGAKLTGAGGGGCVVALVPTPAVAENVVAAWRARDFRGFATRVFAEPPHEGGRFALEGRSHDSGRFAHAHDARSLSGPAAAAPSREGF